MSRQNEKYVLAIDIGTSSTKSALVSIRGEIVDMESEENRLVLLADGGAEQDPDQWWRAIEKTCKRLLAKKMMEEYGAAYMAEGIVTLAASRLYASAADTDEVVDDALVRLERVFRNVDRANISQEAQ